VQCGQPEQDTTLFIHRDHCSDDFVAALGVLDLRATSAILSRGPLVYQRHASIVPLKGQRISGKQLTSVN